MSKVFQGFSKQATRTAPDHSLLVRKMLATMLIAVLAFIAAVYVYGLRVTQRWRYRHFPGPTPPWLIGNVRALSRPGQPIADAQWARTYGPVFAVHHASTTMVMVESPDEARKVLVHSHSRPDVNRNSVLPREMRDRNRTGILWSRREKWRGIRAAWQPVFFTGSLEGYTELMDKSAKLLVEELSQAANAGSTLNIHATIGAMTLNVIGQAAFGVDLHTQAADKADLAPEEAARSSRVRQAAFSMFVPTMNSAWILTARVFPFLLPAIRALASKYPDKPLQTLINSREAVDKMVRELIADHRSILEGGKNSADGMRPEQLRGGCKPGSFIDLLVRGNDRETGQAFSDDVMAQQAATMLLAGYETTANALTFACYLLSRPCNTDKQGKLLAEVDALGRDFTPSFADLEEKLPYMDAVLKEGLRLFPPAHTVIRLAEQDMMVGGYKVPKGTFLGIPAYSIHNNPSYWPDADQFQPERWLSSDAQAAKDAKNCFFAFGDGARVCPGSRFAILEAKITLLRIYQRFTLELAPHQEPLQLRCSITMSAKGGVLVRPVARA